jgi:hypothetical protein
VPTLARPTEVEPPEEVLLGVRELGVGEHIGVDAFVRVGVDQRVRVEPLVEHMLADQDHNGDHEEPDDHRHERQRGPRPGHQRPSTRTRRTLVRS